jgi:lysine 6-dehydrogenase
MNVAVLGAGLMGPSLAMDCLESSDVEEVLLIDIDKEKLKKVAENLGNPGKLKTLVMDVTNREGLKEALKGYDVAGIALLRWLNVEAIWGLIEAGVHGVDLIGSPKKDWDEINSAAKGSNVAIIMGCGVEPGLTDMLAAHGMDLLDCVETVDIWCGGMPLNPRPPMEYKIVFGGPYLPLRPGLVNIIEEGAEKEIHRYTLGEPIRFPGIERELECFYDGFPDALYDVKGFQEVKRCTEKTVRYAGYCEKVKFLDDCGLLGREPIQNKEGSIIPFEVFSKIIYPKVKLEKNEKDFTVLRVLVTGKKGGISTSIKFEMVDYYDEVKKITSMAKTTSYTAAIIARMLGRGEITERGLFTPVKVIRGKVLRRLLEELKERDVNVLQEVKTSQNIS